MNKITYYIVEGTGAPHHKYAGADVTVMTRSIKQGIRMAKAKAYSMVAKSFSDQGIPFGGCPVIESLEVNGVSLLD